MELSFRKLWAVLGVACVGANLAAAATNSTSAQQSRDDHLMVASGLAYAGPVLSEDATGISLGADYVLWQVVQEGTESVISNYYPTGTANSAQGSTGYPKSSLLSGFKVHGAVTINECDNLDLFVQYTWLQRSTKTNTGAGGSTTQAIYLRDIDNSAFAAGTIATNWAASYRIAYNVLDFEIGRLSAIAAHSFAVRPFYGIRGVWNTSTLNQSAFIGTTASTLINLNSYQNTSGAGVRGGLDVEWKFFNNSEYFGGLKLVGVTALSGVYGRTYVDVTTTRTASGTTLTPYNNRSSLNRTVPIVDLAIGLSWDVSFGGETDRDYNLEIHALWDTQTWIGYGKHLTSVLYPSGAQNLSIQGLTVGAELNF